MLLFSNVSKTIFVFPSSGVMWMFLAIYCCGLRRVVVVVIVILSCLFFSIFRYPIYLWGVVSVEFSAVNYSINIMLVSINLDTKM